jgi:hypothetical protein
LVKILEIIGAISFAFGCFVVFAALDHNPQGEFCTEYVGNECRYDWIKILVLGINGSFLTLLPLTSIWLFAWAFTRLRKKRKTKSKHLI